jgi:hypothetical protein
VFNNHGARQDLLSRPDFDDKIQPGLINLILDRELHPILLGMPHALSQSRGTFGTDKTPAFLQIAEMSR